jgi:chromosome partitioning protein
MKIVLAQTKGGVGKTTLAVNLAVARSQAGRDLLLVDADEQGTASDFTALRTEQLGSPGYTAIQLSGSAVRTQVLQLDSKYQDIIIDAGGRDTSGLRAALTVADVAVVPFQPRSFDIWTLDKVADLITEARGYNPNLRAVAVLNFADPQGPDNAAAAAALEGAPGIEFLNTPIGRRKAFPNAAAEGRSVGELKRLDPKASAELTALMSALFDISQITE